MVLHFALAAAMVLVTWEAWGRDRPDEGFEPVAAEARSSESREEYERRVQADLERIDGELEKLEGDTQDLGIRARRRARKDLRELRRRQDEIEERLREARLSSSRRWDIVKGGVDDAMHELRKMIDRLEQDTDEKK